MAKDFKLGALVWAKMKGFSPWPAQVSFPSDGKIPKSKKPQHFVYFYGTNEFAWVSDQLIVPHSEEMLANSRRYKKISSSMQSAIQEIVRASQNIANKSKVLIKKEPASSPPPASSPEKPKTPKRKAIPKKIMKSKRIGERSVEKFKLLSKNKIKKEPASSPPPTPEKPKTPKKKTIPKKIMKTKRISKRSAEKFKLLSKNKIKKEPASSPPPAPEKPKTPKRKAIPKKIMKPIRMSQRAAEKFQLLSKDKIKKEPASSPPPTPEKLKTPKSKAIPKKIMKPIRMSQRAAEKFKLLTKDEIKKESVSTSEKPKTPKKKAIQKKIIDKKSMKVEKMALRLEKKGIKNNKKSPKMGKKSAKKRSATNVMSNDFDKGKNIKAKKNKDSDEDYSTLIANLPPNNALPNVASTSATYNNTSASDVLSNEDYEKYADLIANLPPNNANIVYSNVAVIPPYNEDSPGGFSSCMPLGPLRATSKKIGFLGIGKMGYELVNNLLSTGHSVTIWNRSVSEVYEDLVKKGAKSAQYPDKVIRECDITFCCVSDPDAAKCVVFKEFGVLAGFDGVCGNKAYIELTTIDPETSQDISEAIVGKGGRYLEAPILGTRKDATDNSMVIVTAGDRGLFDECNSIFASWGRHAFYMGIDVGYASKINLILSMLAGTTYAILGELISLAEQSDISPSYFMDMVRLGPMNFPLLVNKGQAMVDNDKTVYTPVKNQQKDMALAVSLGHSSHQPLALAVAANEVYKRAKSPYGESDVSILNDCYKM